MHVVVQTIIKIEDHGVVEVVTWRSVVHDKGHEITVDAIFGCNGGRRNHESVLDRLLFVCHPERVAEFDVFSATGLPKKMAGLACGVNGQGRVLHPSVTAGFTGSNDRAPFSSSTRAQADLVTDWDLSRRE